MNMMYLETKTFFQLCNVCNKSRSRDYSSLSLILVSLTLSLAKTQGSISLAKTQGSIHVRINQRFIHY